MWIEGRVRESMPVKKEIFQTLPHQIEYLRHKERFSMIGEYSMNGEKGGEKEERRKRENKKETRKVSRGQIRRDLQMILVTFYWILS